MSVRLPRIASLIVVAAVVSAGLIAGAAQADTASPSPAASADAKATLTVGITQDIDSANPFTGIVASAYEIYQMQYPTLTNYSAQDFSIVPGLADSWQESADHLTWTYKIRSGLKWSDGEPMTAKDAAYTFNRIINGEYEQTNYGNYVANITKAVATDDTTLVLSVKAANPIMTHLSIYILPEHIWSKVSEAQVKTYKNEPVDGQPVVGGGPFVMAERRVGQFIRMTANPNYAGGPTPIREVVFRVFQNQDAMGQALKKGEIDFADGIEANVAKSLEGIPGITTVNATYSGFNEIAFNSGAALSDGKPIGDGNPVLKDLKFRQAMSWAIDRQTLADKVYGGAATPGSTIIPDMYPAYHLTPATPYTFDPEKAKSLLEAAGYKAGADGVRTGPDGKPIELRLFGRTSSANSKQVVQFVKGWFDAVGIPTTVTMKSEDALTEIIGQGTYDMFEWGWVVEPDPDYQVSTFTCGQRSYEDAGSVLAGLSDSFYCDPAYDKLYAAQGSETDQTKRSDIVKQMQQMLYDSAPYIVTVYYNNLEAYRSDRFTGFVPQPSPSGSLLFQYGVWSYVNAKPVSSAGEGTQPADGSSGSSSGWVIPAGVLVVLIVLAGLVGWLLKRGRGGEAADDRE
ncbi:MAG: ABC transporter substrate-binding protein [Actinomycetes bacterium]